jgi:hypothetical protein
MAEIPARTVALSGSPEILREISPVDLFSSVEARRLKRWLKRGPRLTRQGRAEFARWLLAIEISGPMVPYQKFTVDRKGT